MDQPPEQINLDAEARKLEELIEAAENAGNDAATSAGVKIRACVRVGDKLRQIRKALGHGKWMKWLTDEFTKIKTETARRWMKLSEVAAAGDLLASARSIRHAYQLAGLIPINTEGADSKPAESGNYLVHIDKLVQSLQQIHVETLTPEQRAQLVTRLKPVRDLHDLLLSIESP